MDYTRSFPLEDISIRSEGGGRTVDAYAAIFNTPAPVRDQDGEYEEVLDPGCFNRAIEHARRAGGGWGIPVMYNHGMTIFSTPAERHSVPIGIPEEIRADGRGLFTRTRYHNTPLADEVLESIREGSITAYSFAGKFNRSDPPAARGGFRPDRTGRLPTVRRIESTLREYGPTPFPVYAGAEIVGVRSIILDELQRLITGSGTRDDSPDYGTPDPGPAADDPLEEHSTRSFRQAIRARRAQFIAEHGS